MLSRVRRSRGGPFNAPAAAFIHPCRPVVATRPSTGPGWAHELKHDGYRLQIHVREGRVWLYSMHGNDWTKRYPRIVEEAARLREPLIIDAEVVRYRPTVLPISTLCAAAQLTRKRWPALSIFFFRVTISGVSRLLSARTGCGGCFADQGTAFST
jgi:ATP-dependent DNA ligase